MQQVEAGASLTVIERKKTRQLKLLTAMFISSYFAVTGYITYATLRYDRWSNNYTIKAPEKAVLAIAIAGAALQWLLAVTILCLPLVKYTHQSLVFKKCHEAFAGFIIPVAMASFGIYETTQKDEIGGGRTSLGIMMLAANLFALSATIKHGLLLNSTMAQRFNSATTAETTPFAVKEIYHERDNNICVQL